MKEYPLTKFYNLWQNNYSSNTLPFLLCFFIL
nr:MAG TPA: hypothetical protein [Caudoviricetes sp.]